MRRAFGGVEPAASIRVRVTDSESVVRPPATAWIALTNSAGTVSLSRNPLTPILSAVNTISSTSKVVSTRILRSGCCSRSRWLALIPSIRGMRISMSTRSGASLLTAARASSPSEHSPTISILGSPSKDHPQPHADQVFVINEQDPDALLTSAMATMPSRQTVPSSRAADDHIATGQVAPFLQSVQAQAGTRQAAGRRACPRSGRRRHGVAQSEPGYASPGFPSRTHLDLCPRGMPSRHWSAPSWITR